MSSLDTLRDTFEPEEVALELLEEASLEEDDALEEVDELALEEAEELVVGFLELVEVLEVIEGLCCTRDSVSSAPLLKL